MTVRRKPPSIRPLTRRDIWWFAGTIGLLITFILAILFISAFEEDGVSYVVDGALMGYETKQVFRNKRVFAHILQTDGKVRAYDTEYRPEDCAYHVLGIGIQTLVTPTRNTLVGWSSTRSVLLFDPCGK